MDGSDRIEKPSYKHLNQSDWARSELNFDGFERGGADLK